MKVYRCKVCGKVILILEERKVPTICCGQEMEEEVANTKEAATEKHIPVYEMKGQKVEVNVGSVAHPMEKEHYIMWIALETNAGVQIHYLKPGEEPKATFVLTEEEQIKKVYAYCNLHGLWVKEK